MNLTVTAEEEIKKKSFALSLKPLQSDGLILRIHHTDHNSQKLRFLHTCFNESSDIVASADAKGNLFFINVVGCKFWGLPTLNSCTFLRFSSFKACEIIVGLKSKEILIVNFEIGAISGKLTGHKSAPMNITFANFSLCLTSSKTEAIIWDLQSNTTLKILALERDSFLKYVVFLPQSNHILGCYVDNVINLWEFGTFQLLRILPSTIWNNMDIKNFAFSCDGSMMAISSITPILALYSFKAWKVLKFVNLPEHIKSIKSLRFLTVDEKTTKPILAILSGHGIVLFFDIIGNMVVSELKAANDIIEFEFANRSVFLSCVLCTGDIEIYDITMYVEKPARVAALTEKKLKVKFNQKTSPKKIELLKEELDDVLNIYKLRSILKEYGEYPEAYRTMIWEQLLQLPNNKMVYNGIIKYQVHNAFQNLNKEYPVENRSFNSLKSLLNNLVTWCGFFANVDYLPVFAYPFVKMFQNRPIVCFEAIATILLNWCQYWFEYFPLPPINILAMIENILLEVDPQLLNHMNEYNITSKQYAWPLLESAFSEVLTSQSWFVFWDHILTNEPSFLICSVVGYNLIQRNALLSLTDTKEFEHFYHKQNPLDMKRFVAKCYSLLEKTNAQIHPRKYLNMFRSLEKGTYPIFHGYPKIIIENETQKLNELKRELHNIELEEAKLLLNKKKEIDKMLDSDLESIEKNRLFEMKKACNEKLQNQQVQAKKHLQRLNKLRKKFDDHQAKLLKYSKSDLLRKRMLATDMLYSEIETNQKTDEYQAEKAESLLLRHYSELVKHKMQIEALLNDSSSPIDEPKLHETIRREHKKILRKIDEICRSPDAEVRIRQYNVVSSLLAMDDLIKKVESALAKELSSEYLDISKSEGCIRNIQLQTETEELETEVSNLLNALSKSRLNSSKSKLSTGVSMNTSSSPLMEDKEINGRLAGLSKIESVSTLSSQSSYPSSIKIAERRVAEKEIEKSSIKVKRWNKNSPNKSVRFMSLKKNKTS